jgi:methionyl-tRNA formyltransferase
VPLLARTLPRLAAGQLAFVEQDHASATFCRRLVKDDGRLDFSVPAAQLAARINGLFPWPACSVEIAGQPVKIGLAEALAEEAGALAGAVLGGDTAGLRVVTGRGVLRLLRLQRPGGRLLAAGEFLRGFPIAAGTLLPSFPLTPLVAREPFRK